jgi:FAD/FMN-containing dehydrogenase
MDLMIRIEYTTPPGHPTYVPVGRMPYSSRSRERHRLRPRFRAVVSRRHAADESYQNFPNRLIPSPLQQYFGENLDRLIDVKTAYDPGNLFTNEQGIPVRS